MCPVVATEIGANFIEKIWLPGQDLAQNLNCDKNVI